MSDVRTLGFWEETCKVYHESFGCSGMVLQYARVTGPLTGDLAKSALRWLQQRHPLLHGEFTSHDENYNKFSFDHYTNLSDDDKEGEVPLTIVNREDDTHWKRASEDELASDFAPDARYLWRARLLLGDGDVHDIVLIFHHSISDGPSNAHFVRDFVSYAAELHSGKQKPDNFKEEPRLPPVEHMIPTATEQDSQVKSDLVQEDRDTEHELTPWEFEQNLPLAERRTRNFYHVIDEQELPKLKANTKEHGVTINSVLMAALMDAAFNNKKEEAHALFSTAISLRSYCEPPVGNEHFGCYVMVVNTIHKLGSKVPIWDLAKDCHQGLRNEIASKHQQGFMTPAYKKAEVAETMQTALTNTNKDGIFPGGVVISNIGLLDFPKSYGPFSLEDMFFSTTQVAGNFGFLLWVNSLHGKVYCCLTYTEGLYPKPYAEGIVARFSANIAAACR